MEKPFIPLDTLFEESFSCLQQVVQWQEMNSYLDCSEYSSRAEAIIEIIEVFDCGQVGGFSKGQDQTKTNSLFYRWKFLADKYKYNIEKNSNKSWLKKIIKTYSREE